MSTTPAESLTVGRSAAEQIEKGLTTALTFDDVQRTVRRDVPKVGRNDDCPCGSGKKYKNCHGAGL